MLTNVYGLPEPFVDAARSTYRAVPGRYSVTTLLKGVREAVLQRRHADEIDEDVSDRVWAIFGSAVHSILSQSQAADGQMREQYLVSDLAGRQVSGIFDLYDPATKTVTDYKTASVWKAIKGEWGDWRKQLLMYAWLLRDHGMEVEHGQVVALLRDHSKSKAREAGYPEHPVVVRSWDFGAAEIDAMGAWMGLRVALIAHAEEEVPDGELPMCTEEERWHRGECWAVMKKGAKKAKRLFRVGGGVDSEQAREAAEMRADSLGAGHYVEHRPGEDPKCEGYCAARAFCAHHRAIMDAKEGA